ncbi:MAG: hypothetical protein ABF289_04325, partial [Clostridiales bacterium]
MPIQVLAWLMQLYLEFPLLYHSKYNPIERYWGRLESHLNGDLLDCKETILNFVKTATWHSNVPNVDITNKSYSTGIKVKDRIMKIYESAL